MSRKKPMDKISLAIANKRKILSAIKRGVTETLLKHKLLGKPVVVWQKGKVVLVPPEKIILKKSKKRKN